MIEQKMHNKLAALTIGVRVSKAAMYAATLGALALSSGVVWAQSAERGKAAFEKNGCWQCHGTEGQGGAAGPKLAPEPKPLAFMQVFVRNSKGPMPPYMEAVLSNQDLTDIHAYLQSIPKPADYKSIPALNP